MTKSELVEELAYEAEITPEEALNVVDVFFDNVQRTLLDGGRVEIRGFCSWQMKEYKGYTGRNPNTSQVVEVKPKRLPFFKCGKDLLDLVNSEEAK